MKQKFLSLGSSVVCIHCSNSLSTNNIHCDYRRVHESINQLSALNKLKKSRVETKLLQTRRKIPGNTNHLGRSPLV